MKRTEAQKREALIEHWMWLAKAVFAAEDVVQVGEWKEKLKKENLDGMSAEERELLAQEYLRAIATEIVTHGDN